MNEREKTIYERHEGGKPRERQPQAPPSSDRTDNLSVNRKRIELALSNLSHFLYADAGLGIQGDTEALLIKVEIERLMDAERTIILCEEKGYPYELVIEDGLYRVKIKPIGGQNG